MSKRREAGRQGMSLEEVLGWWGGCRGTAMGPQDTDVLVKVS